jgi:hypothetical protein
MFLCGCGGLVMCILVIYLNKPKAKPNNLDGGHCEQHHLSFAT